MGGAAANGNENPNKLIAFLLMILFWVGNVGLNVYNKWLFGRGNFKAPLFVTISHQFYCFLGALIMAVSGLYERTPVSSKKMAVQLLTISVFFAMNVSLNNSSLVYLTLSANQIIRALLPALCAIFSTCIEGKRFSIPQWSALVLLVLGVVLALLDNPTFDLFGTILCGSSVLGAALHVTVVGFFVGGKIQMHAFDVLLYTTVPVIVVLTPAFLASNEPQTIQAFYETMGPEKTLGYVSLGGCLAFFYNVIHYVFIHYTSSVYTTVAGNMKVAMIVASSFIFLDDEATPLNVIGLCLAGIAFFWNSYLEFSIKNKKKKETSTDGEDAEGFHAENQNQVLDEYDEDAVMDEDEVNDTQPLLSKKPV